MSFLRTPEYLIASGVLYPVLKFPLPATRKANFDILSVKNTFKRDFRPFQVTKYHFGDHQNFY